MNWLARYRLGEHQEVWDEIVAAGLDLRAQPERWGEAAEVAAELMRRARRNVERVHEALNGLGYRFEANDEVIARPPTDAQRLLGEIEAVVGALPLSLTAWICEVGGVNLNGTHPDWAFEYTDPLVVECDLSSVIDDYQYRHQSGWFEMAGTTKLPLYLAPDYLHKAHVSGGDPYGIELPDGGADVPWRNDDLHPGATLVGYLRSALLDWAGFPGWSRREPEFAEPQQPFPEELTRVAAGLERF